MLLLLFKPKVLLAPGSAVNIEKSIANTESPHMARYHLDEKFLKDVTKDGKEVLHCWAFTKSRKKIFDDLNHGDIFLLSEKGTGRFNYYGVVNGKIHSAAFGSDLWPVEGEKVYEYIIFLTDIRPINLEKRSLLRKLGFKDNYELPGPNLVELEHNTITDLIGLPAEGHVAKDDPSPYVLNEPAGSREKIPPTKNIDIDLADHAENNGNNCSSCGVQNASFVMARRIQYTGVPPTLPLNEVILCEQCMGRLLNFLRND